MGVEDIVVHVQYSREGLSSFQQALGVRIVVPSRMVFLVRVLDYC